MTYSRRRRGVKFRVSKTTYAWMRTFRRTLDVPAIVHRVTYSSPFFAMPSRQRSEHFRPGVTFLLTLGFHQNEKNLLPFRYSFPMVEIPCERALFCNKGLVVQQFFYTAFVFLGCPTGDFLIQRYFGQLAFDVDDFFRVFHYIIGLASVHLVGSID